MSSVIDVGTSSTPFLFDFDYDNDLDLICGAFNGKIFFYRNIGDSLNFLFESVPDFFHNIDVGDNSTPTIIDFDNDGKSDLFSGNREGKIFYYRNVGNNISPLWQETPFELGSLSFGGYSQIIFTDIDNDTDMDLMIGNVKGVIYFFKNKIINAVNIAQENIIRQKLSIETFPNPFNSNLKILISINTFDFVSIDVYNILGKKIKTIYSGFLDVGKHQFDLSSINTNPEMSSGTYLIVVRNSETTSSQKVLMIK